MASTGSSWRKLFGARTPLVQAFKEFEADPETKQNLIHLIRSDLCNDNKFRDPYSNKNYIDYAFQTMNIDIAKEAITTFLSLNPCNGKQRHMIYTFFSEAIDKMKKHAGKHAIDNTAINIFITKLIDETNIILDNFGMNTINPNILGGARRRTRRHKKNSTKSRSRKIRQ